MDVVKISHDTVNRVKRNIGWSEKRLRDEIESAGFKVVKIEHVKK